MPVGSLPVTLAIAAAFSLAAVAAPAAPRAPENPPPRKPLAMTLGLVPPPQAERTDDALARSLSSPAAILRLPPDDLVAALIESTRTSNLAATIGTLESFVTRYVVADSCLASGLWIHDRFLEMGYADVRLDTFRTWTFQDSVLALNVLAVKPGVSRPDEYVVLGGHYDSVTTDNFEDPLAPAPGADDNASGIAGVLEAARVLRDVPTDRSVVFACWSAEEVGLWGSRAWVADALAESLAVVLYLNMDCIGYDDGEPIVGVIYADSLAAAVGAYMADVSARFLGIPFTTTVQPIGASDQNSFWEAGYRVVDTSPNTQSPHHHTPLDLLENMSPGLARALAAVNVAAVAAVAGVTGEDANLPPETTLVGNCAAAHPVLTLHPTFEWEGVDFDGAVAGYEYRARAVDGRGAPPGRLGPTGCPGGAGPDDWTRVPAWQTAVTLELAPDGYVFEVRARDDAGVADPSPARHTFAAADTLAPALTVVTNFLPEPLVFVGPSGAAPSVPVFENERLVFTVSADASSYCGAAEAVEIAVGDTAVWDGPVGSPHGFVVRPAVSDTVVFFRTRDENGAVTLGRLALAPVAAPMDLPLLHVDDWLDGDAPEPAHDAFYDSLLAHQERQELDPIERIGAGLPALPTMEELGRFRSVLWTVDRNAFFLRTEQARKSYHALEGFVRAGGNLILEGQTSLASLDGRDAFTYRPRYAPGDFIHDHAGIDSLANSGGSWNPAWPESYGWAFLGTTPEVSWLSALPVDTLGKWSAWYGERGGIPWCEVVRPTDGGLAIFLFESHLNPALEGQPCATLRLPTDGTGAVAWLGFPFYYLRTAPAAAAVDSLLARIRDWQAPLELISFDWTAEPDRVHFSWRLAPPGTGATCDVERAATPEGAFVRLNLAPIPLDPWGFGAYADSSVAPGAPYAYRLMVTERWGGTTTHGPWEVVVPAEAAADGLSAPRPNPATAVATIGFSVRAEGQEVSLVVYDLAGRVVRRLYDGTPTAGLSERAWDLANEERSRVAAGVYFVRATIGARSFERKVVVVR